MKNRKDLDRSLLYESVYAPVQTTDDRKKSEWLKIKYAKRQERDLRKELHGHKGWFFRTLRWLWKNSFGYWAEEWTFLAILGILIALISYMIDKAVWMCNSARVWLYRDLSVNNAGRYFGWISLPVCLCMFSAGFVKLTSTEAIGSGLQGVKVMLRGVYMPHFVAFRTLISKLVGITATLGSSMPLGKEGPVVHIACCCVKQMCKLTSFKAIWQNESRKVEMFAAAAAVGCACVFAAPISGVLLSVELTTSYYATHNYWRCFCAAIWGTTCYRLLLVWCEGVESITPLFKASFHVEYAYAAQELFAFSVLGIICGLGCAFYMRCRMIFGAFVKTNKVVVTAKKINFFIYPFFISLVVASINFPLGIGKYVGGHLGYAVQVTNMFSNFSWTKPNLTIAERDIVKNWETDHTSVYLHLVCLIAFNFVCSILSASMPIPNGSFAPSFRMGAATGRILGELMYHWYPHGLSYYGRRTAVMPGGYAKVGAAAWAGAATQTMSAALITMEFTGQLTHVIPTLIAVLISNCIAQLAGPSLYDLAIKSKNLPYLPAVLPHNSGFYNVYVEDFMRTQLSYVYHGMEFGSIKQMLKEQPKVESFPLVDNANKMILLGSISRGQLIGLLELHLGKERRLEELKESEERAIKEHEDVNLYDFEDYFQDNPLYTEPEEGSPASHPKRPRRRVCDLCPTNQQIWTNERLKLPADFSVCHIDPAPFQLVQRTSLLKVHTLFSMVGISHAYVTRIGRLIGLVRLEDLRKAIADVKSGALKPHNIEIVVGEEK